jgi:hypothetical protein
MGRSFNQNEGSSSAFKILTDKPAGMRRLEVL